MSDVATARRLMLDAEAAIFNRLAMTTDPAERRALEVEIEELSRLQRQLDRADLAAGAAELGALARIIENAVSALRTRPFDRVLAAYQDLLDRIGSASPPSPAAEDSPAPAVPAAPPPADAPPSAAAAPPQPSPTASIAETLAELFQTCKPRPERIGTIDRFYVRPFLAGRPAYEQVEREIGVPWWVVGLIHGMECAFSFEKHLHNGDPLTERTMRHPAGRPRDGSPPFAWLPSALDAIRQKGWSGADDWQLGPTLDRLERYNGLGYRNRGLPTPYLWSFSQHFTRGKFVRDREFDPNAGSEQCGAAVLLKRIEQRGAMRVDDGRVMFDEGDIATLAGAPRTAGVDAAAIQADLPTEAAAELAFPEGLAPGVRNRRGVERLQSWLTLAGEATMIDGLFGSATGMALAGFQTREGLPVTSEVDPRCWAALTAPMRRAVAPEPATPGEGFADVLLRVAARHIAETPRELVIRGESNSGPWVRLYMKGRDGAAQKWCAGFVCSLIEQTARSLGVASPIRRRHLVADLVADAKRADRFIAGAVLSAPEARRARLPAGGTLFALRGGANGWFHVGLVTAVDGDAYRTIEGNTNEAGGAEGIDARPRTRRFGSADFVLLS